MIKNYAEWLNESTEINLGPFKQRMRTYYGHIHHNMSDIEIQKFLAQPHVAKAPLNRQVDMFADYLVSQGLADVVAEGTTYVFNVYPRDEHGDHIPSKKKVVKIKRADQSSAKDELAKKYPNSEFFSELDSKINEGEEEIDPKELEVGKEVEMEHTTDEKEAEKIAKDHLAEDPEYYKKLRDAGLIDEPEALQKAKELDEMAEGDIHFKAIVSLWNKSDNQGKRRILDAVGHGVHDFNSLKKELRDMDYEDILDVEKELGSEEPIEDSMVRESSRFGISID